jgi:translocation and assembly module TamB
MKIRTALLALALAAVGTPLVLSFAVAVEDDGTEKSALVRFVEDKLSTPDRKIALGAIDGALSSDVRLASITVADRQGVWLTIRDVHLVWSRLALLRGKLDVDSLEAASIDVARKPLPPEVADPAASDGFSLPDLPVAVKIGRLAAPRVTLGAPLAGETATLAVEAEGSLEDGSLDTALSVHRTDARPGEIALKAAYAASTRQLDLDLSVSEPAGGVIAGLLNLPGRPSVALGLKGAGPLDDFVADLDLATDGVNRLSGRTTLNRANDGYRFASRLQGDLTPLVPPDYALYFAGGGSLDLSGARSDAGAVALDHLVLDTPALKLQGSAALAPDGFPTALSLDGRLGTPGGALPLGGAGSASKLGEGTFRLAFGNGGRWSLDLSAKDLDSPTLRVAALKLTGAGNATDLADPAKRHVDFSLDGGSSGLAFSDPALGEAVGGELGLSGRGTWSAGRPLSLEALDLRTPTTQVGFAGTYANGIVEGTAKLATSLAPFSGLADRPLAGHLDTGLAGTFSPGTGAFDFRLDGSAADLATGIKPLDGLLAGTTRLAGRLGRSTAGLSLSGFSIGNPAFTLTADGDHARSRTDLTATLALTDLARVDDRLKGPVGATLSIKGTGGPLDVAARLSAGRLGLAGETLEATALDFTGRLDGSRLDGRLDGKGRLGRDALSLAADLSSPADGSRKLSGLKLAVGPAGITGDLTVSPAGLATGRLAVAAPDIGPLARLALVEASGRLDADVTLAPSGSSQNATIKAKATDLAGLGGRIGSAEIEAGVADLFGNPRIDGSATAQRLGAAGASIRTFSGKARGTAAATEFDVALAGLSHPAVAAAGIDNLGIVASGRLAGDRVTLAKATLSGPSGLVAEAHGDVPLKGGPLGVDVTASLPLTLANAFVAERGTRLTGTARADVHVGGRIGEPDLQGTVTLSGGTLVDPLTTLSLDAIEARLRLSGDRIVLDTAAARIKRGGRLSAAGSLGIAGDRPVDLAITATGARLTDGELATADIDAKLELAGSLRAGLSLSGDVAVAKAEITVPEGGGASAAAIDVKHNHPPAPVKATLGRIAKAEARGKSDTPMPPVALDLAIDAPSKLFVRGRGIDAELGGHLKVGGTLADVRPVGSFKLIRGRVLVIGQRITLNSGEVTLQGNLDPYLSLSATTKSEQVSVTATVQGLASGPTIVLSSTPELPEDEILARFLFKRSISDLSPLQIAQLATAVVQLAGGSRGNGLVDRLRAHVGLDDLDVVTDDKGNAAVRAGRYVSEKVYLGVTAGNAGQTGVSVNLDITDDVKARAEATQAGSKVGVYYEHEY